MNRTLKWQPVSRPGQMKICCLEASLCDCVRLAEGNTKRNRKRKPGFLFVCLHHMHYLLDCVCVGLPVLVLVCGCMNCIFAQIQLAQTTGFGHRAWLPFCKHSQAKNYVLNLLIHTNIHRNTKAPGKQCWLTLANVPQNPVHTHCVYTHMAHFSIGCLINLSRRWKISRTFGQQCLFFDKRFIWREVCSQGHARSTYFKQPLTHPGAGLNTCSSQFSSPVNSISVSSSALCLLLSVYLQSAFSLFVAVAQRFCSYLHSFTE